MQRASFGIELLLHGCQISGRHLVFFLTTKEIIESSVLSTSIQIPFTDSGRCQSHFRNCVCSDTSS